MAIANLGQQHDLHWIEERVVPAMAFKAGSHAVDHHSAVHFHLGGRNLVEVDHNLRVQCVSIVQSQ